MLLNNNLVSDAIVPWYNWKNAAPLRNRPGIDMLRKRE